MAGGENADDFNCAHFGSVAVGRTNRQQQRRRLFAATRLPTPLHLPPAIRYNTPISAMNSTARQAGKQAASFDCLPASLLCLCVCAISRDCLPPPPAAAAAAEAASGLLAPSFAHAHAALPAAAAASMATGGACLPRTNERTKDGRRTTIGRTIGGRERAPFVAARTESITSTSSGVASAN